MDAALNVHKPAGLTSHDVVDQIRRWAGQRRVGHGGTLDPQATGVLLLGLGAATRLLEYVHALTKTYRAEFTFGLVTSTQDVWGETLEERDAATLTAAQVEAALAGFRGEIEQTPPMVSAVRVDGERLYRRARRGEEVNRPARRIQVEQFDLLDFHRGERPVATARIVCSSGTYVRTLGHDLGQASGCGAAMSALVREAVGPFRLTTAAPLDELLAQLPENSPWLLPPGELAVALPVWPISAEERGRLCFGRAITAANAEAGRLYRAMDAEGRLIAIVRSEAAAEGVRLAPEKVLATPHAATARA